jgi:potassium-transporting ATPase KdpC subunit
MAGLRKDLATAVIAIVAMTIVLGLAYPLVITGIAQVVFPGSANGSKVSYHGHVVGSKLIGQEFTEPQIGKDGKPVRDEEGDEVRVANPAYFQPRPSATGYSANVTYFGNGGPNSAEVRDEIREELADYVKLNKPYDRSLTREDVPVDAVTQSGSGVDPDISEANAQIQAHRIAAVRHLSLSRVEDLIAAHIDGRSLGVLGESGVNVLELNIALDEEAPSGAKRK